MIPFHSVLPEIAQREVRCIHVGDMPAGTAEPGLPAGEYAYVEFYCDDLECDCRQVSFQVIARNQGDKIFASFNYGWEKEAFYRKRLSWDPDEARAIVRGELDPNNPQSEFAEELLSCFWYRLLDEPYRLRLRRHYRLFREELQRRAHAGNAP